MPSVGTSNKARYSRVGVRYGGARVTVDGTFESNRSKIGEVPSPIP